MRANVYTADLTHSRGIALIVGLLLMASMVLLALAVATGMLLEKRMAGNFADGQLALQRAELAGQWADYWLESRASNPLDPDCTENCGPTPPFYAVGQLPAFPEHEDLTWWRAQGAVAGVDPLSGEQRMDYTLTGTEQPLWLIEELHLAPIEGLSTEPEEAEPQLGYYRVLARGSGRFPGSIAVTETILARPWAEEFLPALYPPPPGGPWFCDQVPETVPCGRVGSRRRR
jgi:Tfp pilus assembly protein PilX